MTQGAYVLLANATADDDEVEVAWPGGACWFVVDATFGGGTVKLQYKTPAGAWMDVPSGSVTADGIVALTIPGGGVRVNIVTSTAVYAWLIGNPS